MNYIIITRNPNGKGILAIIQETEDDYGVDEIAQFETEQEAESCAEIQPLCQAWGYQIVELEV